MFSFGFAPPPYQLITCQLPYIWNFLLKEHILIYHLRNRTGKIQGHLFSYNHRIDRSLNKMFFVTNKDTEWGRNHEIQSQNWRVASHSSQPGLSRDGRWDISVLINMVLVAEMFCSPARWKLILWPRSVVCNIYFNEKITSLVVSLILVIKIPILSLDL